MTKTEEKTILIQHRTLSISFRISIHNKQQQTYYHQNHKAPTTTTTTTKELDSKIAIDIMTHKYVFILFYPFSVYSSTKCKPRVPFSQPKKTYNKRETEKTKIIHLILFQGNQVNVYGKCTLTRAQKHFVYYFKWMVVLSD